MNAGALKLFLSYAHKDDKFRLSLSAHISPLVRMGLIEEWTDRLISASSDWSTEISNKLNEADLIILLISSDFINSAYCFGIEMKQALARHNTGLARVVPVIARPCLWQGLQFAKIQALPIDAKPISKWDDKDSAYLSVVQRIENLSRELLANATPSLASEWNTPLLYRRKVVRIVQTVLKERGLYFGQVDGEPAHMHLRSAVREFQKEFNFSPDGLIGPETLRVISQNNKVEL